MTPIFLGTIKEGKLFLDKSEQFKQYLHTFPTGKRIEVTVEKLKHPRRKPKHTMFAKKFRDSDTLKVYVKRAASGPSKVKLSKLNDDQSRPVGTPCLLIIREFCEPIGLEPNQVCLVVVADFQGKLIAAYPATKTVLG